MLHIIRTDISDDLYTAIRHLSVDLRKPVSALVIDGLLLLLRYHDRGAGWPAPEPPTASSVAKIGGAK